MKPLGKITHNRYVSAVRKELKAWHGIGEDERNRMMMFAVLVEKRMNGEDVEAFVNGEEPEEWTAAN
jgi:hypothetical protein